MSFIFEKQNIKDVILIKPKVFCDNRGFFIESCKESDFVDNGINFEFKQDIFLKSEKNVLRGLHYQKNQAKLVKCVKGKILDVAADIRPESPTFLSYVKVELSEDNQYMLYIPHGFAHGFFVLSDEASVNYKVSCEFDPEKEGGIVWHDKNLNIDWGFKVEEFEPVISEKDKILPYVYELDFKELMDI